MEYFIALTNSLVSRLTRFYIFMNTTKLYLQQENLVRCKKHPELQIKFLSTIITFTIIKR